MACVALVALVARLVTVGLFASSLPVFDQWDAEGAHLLRPWLHGNLQLSDLFMAHNEHRVAVTRLFTLALFQANSGEWDNLVEACANAFLFASLFGLLFIGLHRSTKDTRECLAGTVVLSALAAMPYAWENALTGFQSQFYAMFLCLVGMVMVASRVRIGWGALAALAVLGVVSLFTMAAGLLAPLAASAALLMRWRDERLPRVPLVATLATMACVSLVGLWLVPAVPWHAGMRAQGVGDFLDSALAMLFWPFAPRLHKHMEIRAVCALLLWLPWLLFAGSWLRGRRANAGERIAFVVAAWALVQTAATAYARGHGISWVWSRYMEIAALAGACNAFLAVRWAAAATITPRRWLASGAWLAMFLAALASRTSYDMTMLRDAEAGIRAQRVNTLAFLDHGDPSVLDKPVPQIPYPDPARLREYLTDPTLRSILPREFRPAGLPPGKGLLSMAAARWQAAVRRVAGSP
jgi:hypothetical protein